MKKRNKFYFKLAFAKFLNQLIMIKSLFLIGSITCILFVSCKGSYENPGQEGNRLRLDIFHQQKKVK